MEALSIMIAQDLPAILCLVLGFALVVVEMYVPGFGLPGISGLVLLVIGVVLMADSALEALAISGVLLALLIVALTISLRSIAKGRLAKSRLVLHSVSDQPKQNEYGYDKFIGQTGEALTMLRPSGMARFGEEKLNVVSDGDFIEAGAPVRVLRVDGNRIVVQKAG